MTTPLRNTDSAYISIADLPSMLPAGVDPKHAFGLDAYWHQWASGSSATWTTFAIAKRLHDATGAPMPSALHSRFASLDFVFERGRRERLLSILGALDSFHVLSAQQLAFWVQDPRLASGKAADLRTLFSLGLVDVGHTSMLRGADSLTLYRLANTDVWERQLAPLLTQSERISVSGGLPLSTAHRFDRHDSVLATFLARCATWLLEIHAVYGEKYSVHDLLLAMPGARRPMGVNPLAAVDGVMTRDDGSIILVELQASDPGPRFAEKLIKLAEILHLNPRFSLLVLTLPRHVGAGRPDGSIASGAKSSIVKALKSDPRYLYGGVAERVFQADWAGDFFPEPGAVHKDFLTLRTNRYDQHTAQWVKTDMLDAVDGLPLPLDVEDDPNAMASVIQSLLLRQSPKTLRERVRPLYVERIPQLWQTVVATATAPIPLLATGCGALTGVATSVPLRLRNLDED